MKTNLTQAQSLLLQGLIPLLGGALVTTATAGYQAVTTGHVDPTSIGNFVLATFLVAIGQALKGYIPAHIPQELAALKDTQQQVLNELATLTMSRPAVRPPTAPTAAIPAFTPPARPTVPQQPFPTTPPVPTQPPTTDLGG